MTQLHTNRMGLRLNAIANGLVRGVSRLAKSVSCKERERSKGTL